MPRTRNLFLLGSLLLGLALSGCGPRNPATAKVEGVVTLDGEPIEGAAVVFTPSDGRMATGATDSSGRFILSTFKQGDGAVLGQHRVTVSKSIEQSRGAGEEGELIFITPRKYADPKTSPLTCEVQPEIPPVRLELVSEEPPPPAAADAARPAADSKAAAPAAAKAAQPAPQ